MNQQTVDNFGGATVGSSDVVQNDNVGKEFTSGTGGAYDFFTFMAYPPYDSLPTKFVDLGQTEFEQYMGYISISYNIVRDAAPDVIEGGDTQDGIHQGVLGATGGTIPDQFTAPGHSNY